MVAEASPALVAAPEVAEGACVSNLVRVIPADRPHQRSGPAGRGREVRVKSELALPIGHISVPAPPASEEKSIPS